MPETLRALLDHGANVGVHTPSGRSLFWHATVVRDRPDGILEMLMDAGAPLDDTVDNAGEEMDYPNWSLHRPVSPAISCRLLDAGGRFDVAHQSFKGELARRLHAAGLRTTKTPEGKRPVKVILEERKPKLLPFVEALESGA